MALVFCDARAESTASILRYPSEQYWSDPEHVNAFLGTYGVLAPVEPPVTPDEEELLTTLVQQMRTSPQLAAQRLQAALKPGSSARLDFTLGNLFLESGRLDAAISAYRRAIRKAPDYLRAHKTLGVALCQKGEFAPAIASLAKAVSLGASDSLTFGTLGYCYLQTGKVLSAESAYRHATIFEPDDLDWKRGLSRALIEEQKYAEAMTILDEVIAARPDDTLSWIAHANACVGAGNMKRAAANFEVVRRMGKANADMLLTLGDIHLNDNALDLALDAYLAALALNANLPARRLARAGEILVQRGGLDEAGRLLERVRTSAGDTPAPRDASALLKFEARLEIAREHRDNATALLEKALTVDPLDGEALLLLANHHRAGGAIERAALYYERAAKDRVTELEALLSHAQMFVGQSRFREAVPLLERALKIHPQENVAQYLRDVRLAAEMQSSGL